MKNSELITGFLNNTLQNGKGSNLYIENNELINYETCIAIRGYDYIILNTNHYSPTTSVHQNQIRRSGKEYVEVTEEEINEFRSKSYPELLDREVMNNCQKVENEYEVY